MRTTNNSPIDSWSEYLAGELKRQYGMTERQAKDTVVLWFKSLDREAAVQPQPLARGAFASGSKLVGAG